MREISQWNEVLSEADVLEVFGMKKGQLDRLRNEKGFPFVKLSHANRVYLFPDIAEWLCRHRKTIRESVKL
jgi:predicted DNA-binding transcriptional regulator AlpA